MRQPRGGDAAARRKPQRSLVADLSRWGRAPSAPGAGEGGSIPSSAWARERANRKSASSVDPASAASLLRQHQVHQNLGRMAHQPGSFKCAPSPQPWTATGRRSVHCAALQVLASVAPQQVITGTATRRTDAEVQRAHVLRNTSDASNFLASCWCSNALSSLAAVTTRKSDELQGPRILAGSIALSQQGQSHS